MSFGESLWPSTLLLMPGRNGVSLCMEADVIQLEFSLRSVLSTIRVSENEPHYITLVNFRIAYIFYVTIGSIYQLE